VALPHQISMADTTRHPQKSGFDATLHTDMAGIGQTITQTQLRKACALLVASGAPLERVSLTSKRDARRRAELAHHIGQVMGPIPTDVEFVRDPITRDVRRVTRSGELSPQDPTA